MALQPPEDAEIIRSPLGTTWIWRPVPSVLVCLVKGVLTSQAASKMDEVLRRVTADVSRHEDFYDWEGMTDYDGEARIQLTNTALSMRSAYERVHMLVRSKTVALGVKVASAVVPGFVVHMDRPSFENALAESLQRHGKR
jgi:hypothetical protein